MRRVQIYFDLRNLEHKNLFENIGIMFNNFHGMLVRGNVFSGNMYGIMLGFEGCDLGVDLLKIYKNQHRQHITFIIPESKVVGNPYATLAKQLPKSPLLDTLVELCDKPSYSVEECKTRIISSLKCETLHSMAPKGSGVWILYKTIGSAKEVDLIFMARPSNRLLQKLGKASKLYYLEFERVLYEGDTNVV